MTFGDNNSYNGSYQQPYGGGYYYAGANNQQEKQNNFLSQADIERLMKQKNQFSLALTEEDKLRAYCNHRTADGYHDALVTNPDGTYTCQICGYTFKPVDGQETTRESIQNAVNEITDILQTIKLLFVDMDSSVAKEYFQIIPLIQKVVDLFDLAVKDYSKHERANPFDYGKRNLGTAQMFSALSGMFNGNYQQPQQQNNFQQYGNPYQQPQGYQGQQQYGYSNGFGTYGNPQQFQQAQPQNNGYHPQSSGFAYNPGQYTAQPQQPTTQQQNNQQPNVAAPVNNTTSQPTAANTEASKTTSK